MNYVLIKPLWENKCMPGTSSLPARASRAHSGLLWIKVTGRGWGSPLGSRQQNSPPDGQQGHDRSADFSMFSNRFHLFLVDLCDCGCRHAKAGAVHAETRALRGAVSGAALLHWSGHREVPAPPRIRQRAPWAAGWRDGGLRMQLRGSAGWGASGASRWCSSRLGVGRRRMLSLSEVSVLGGNTGQGLWQHFFS